MGINKGSRKGPSRPPAEYLQEKIDKRRKNCVKILIKEVKKSKQFEIRKIIKRLKDAGKDEASTAKLEKQLADARAADVQVLAVTSAISHSLCTSEEAGQQGLTEKPEPVIQRILGARCVLDKVVEIRKEIIDLKTSIEKVVARAAKMAEKEKAQADKATDKEDGDKTEDDETTKQLLQKLKQKPQLPGSNSDNDDDDDDSVSDDSGLIDQEMSDLSDISDMEEEQIDKKKNQKAEKKPQKPKKPKNRLGQRARRALAEQMHGSSAAHYKTTDKKQSRGEYNRPTFERQKPRYEERKPRREPQKKEEELPEHLHPSWLARKQQAEQQRQQLFAAQGTKVTFDDDSD